MGKKHKFTASEREARKFFVGMTILVAVMVAIGVFFSIEITSSRRGETIPRGVPVYFARPEDAMPPLRQLTRRPSSDLSFVQTIM